MKEMGKERGGRNRTDGGAQDLSYEGRYTT